MESPSHEVKCLSCSAEAGVIMGGRFVPHPWAPPARRKGGLLRCGRCGGSLYLEPTGYKSARPRSPGPEQISSGL